MNIAIITLDSLRYDTAMLAKTPNFDRIFDRLNISDWQKVGSHGTYTLPSHIALFQAGHLPCNNNPEIEGPYNKDKMRLFKTGLYWNKPIEVLYPTPPECNVVKGFSKMGYRTIGIGGVHWFNINYPTSSFWGEMFFDEFYWDESMGERDCSAFENQIILTEKLLSNHSGDLFYFVNVPSTHVPFMNFGDSIEGQAKCLEYVDSHINTLLDLLPKPCHVVIFSDHGECFGEDGLRGHSFYHPKVMEVPMVSFII